MNEESKNGERMEVKQASKKTQENNKKETSKEESKMKENE